MTKKEKTHPEVEEETQKTLSKEEELQEEIEKLKDKFLRTSAELENYRKRAEKEREETTKYAISTFARELLSVADNLRRAVESVPEKHDSPEKLLHSLMEGVEITEKELLSVFHKHSIEKIDPLGKPFDHHFHQAMFEQEDKDQPPGTVVHVLQVGYRLHGRLLRPALVGVVKGKKSDPIETP
ncbi:MAG: molecular chaperone [uncultured bacterium]|nr:MAG: molecular chaperone [uncultured bacterium]OFW70058.1 MAG: nucleotide exchange factor GrpE [Alphaproteobacteria bacterium GWC2_42_16]OFW74558.1 MAG: nucleotide exchange factor GrpE [Alphaproteobacteria bacterium GWA2_41_27]OFW84830.1 MAG: nucleotide exchange factor GrpE [Alphaproteobacteria bacterium RIFCSPHIGHO2_12_FULL_42_100]OFW86556.1 MAG: nucleotide exchange factor GrpE [Alphaproteobacteria bacterium RBG_16_42_14]OFW90952.1 MAG: nucleotide exchange factor GrpE [Alphaproteobacteria 